jgi:sulfate transport system ATP-binding protein
MRQGRIEQIGTPAEIWERPATPFIFRFLGDVNVLPARHENGGIAVPGLVIDRLEGEWPRTGDARAYVRTHDIEVRALANGAAHGSARIRFLSSLGPTVRIEVETADGEALVEVELPRERIDLDALKVGTSVSLHARTGRLFAGDPA